MDKEKFEKLTEEALASIPRRYKKLLDNITVIVEDNPPPEIYHQKGIPHSHLILGLYHGVPYKHRGPYYGNVPPDVISIYQKQIERICSNEAEIKAKIQEVIQHEIGHYFGMTEPHLRNIERESRKRGKN